MPFQPVAFFNNNLSYLQTQFSQLSPVQKKVVLAVSLIFGAFSLLSIFNRLYSLNSKKVTSTSNDSSKTKNEWKMSDDGKQLIHSNGVKEIGTFVEVEHEGQKRQVFDGKGKIVSPDGKTTYFRGTFKKGKPIQGTYLSEDGTKWKGTFKNALLHGECTLIQPDGTKETANFENGKKDDDEDSTVYEIKAYFLPISQNK